MTIRCYLVFELTLVNDLLWDVLQVHLHELWSVWRGVWVHIRNIHGEAFTARIGQDMVPVELDCFNVRCFCGDNAWVVCDEVTTHCDLCPLWFFFLWLDCAYNSRVGDCATFWDLVFVDELDGVCALDSTADALSQVSKFISS